MTDNAVPSLSTSPLQAEDRLAREIGQRILDARNGLGWSQQGLHAKTKLADSDRRGISRAVLSLYETGGSKPGAREIRLLCEALKITPNWLLYGTDSPARALQASMDFLRGSELQLSVRLAYAMLALDPVERDALATLIFSTLTKKMGDVKLSSLMLCANLAADGVLSKVVAVVGEDAKNKPLLELLDAFVAEEGSAFLSNYGNTRPIVPDDEIDTFDPDSPPPPRKLRGSRGG